MAKYISFACLLFLSWTTNVIALNESSKPSEINIYLDESPPFSSFDLQKQAKGIYVNYWKQWSTKSGIAVKFFPAPEKDLDKLLISHAPSLYSGLNISDLSLKNMQLIKSKLVVISPNYYFLRKEGHLNKQLIDKNQRLVVGGLLADAQKLPEFANKNNLIYKKFPGLLEALISLYRNEIDALVLFTAQGQKTQWVEIFLSSFLNSSTLTSSKKSLFYYTTKNQHILVDWIAWGKQDLAINAMMEALKTYSSPYLGLSITMTRNMNIGIVFLLLFIFIWLVNAKRKKDQQFKNILNSAPSPLIILSIDGQKIYYLNDAVAILFAFKLTKKTFYFEVEKNQKLLEKFVSGLSHQSIIETSLISLIVDNKFRDIEISAKCVHYKGGSAWLCYLKDVTAQLNAQKKLLNECYLLRTELGSILGKISYKSFGGHVIGCNKAWEAAHNASAESATGKLFSSFFNNKQNEIQTIEDKDVWAGNTFSTEQFFAKEEDKSGLIEVTKALLPDDHAGILGRLPVDNDIIDLHDLTTQLKNKNEQQLEIQRVLSKQNILLKTVFKATVEPVVLLDDNDNIIDATDSFVYLLGYDNLDLLRKYLSNFKIKDCEWIFQQNKELLSSESPIKFEVLIKHKNIETWCEIHKSVLKDAMSHSQCIVVMVKNISAVQNPEVERRINTRRMTPDLFIDNLTRIPDRRSFDLKFDALWGEVHEQNEMISLVLCKLDDFNAFTDKHDHVKGDQVLQLFAQALNSAATKVDCFVARYHYDQFIFIFKGGNATKALKTTKKMFDASHEVLFEEYKITLSMGLSSMFPSHLTNKKMLVAEAELAMEDAKLSGKDQIGVH